MKTINIHNLKVKEFAIFQEADGAFSIGIVYSLLDQDQKEIFTKRADLKKLELTSAQKIAIQKVATLILDTAKNIEKI